MYDVLQFFDDVSCFAYISGVVIAVACDVNYQSSFSFSAGEGQHRQVHQRPEGVIKESSAVKSGQN